MSQNITRRGLVAATPAAIVAASLPALAARAHSDAELLALREPFDRTWRAYVVALDSEDDNSPLVIGTCAANREIVDEMCRRRAYSIEGIAFKAKVSLEHEENLHEALVTSVMDDILSMVGAHA